MLKKAIIFIIFAVTAVVSIAVISTANTSTATPQNLTETPISQTMAENVQLTAQSKQSNLILIAHAGGGIIGYEGSNSLEAMQNSVLLGFDYIELDMLPAADGEIVMTHDWEYLFNRIPKMGNQPVYSAEFMRQRIFNRFTPLNLAGLIDFLTENPNVRIITDTKESNYAALYAIAERFPSYKNRFIAQAYNFDDIQTLKNLGFADVILTVYLLPYELKANPQTIANLAEQHNLWGVAIPDELATAEFANGLNLSTANTRFFVHTINSLERAEQLAKWGFSGIYTAFLAYENYTLVSTFDNAQFIQDISNEVTQQLSMVDTATRQLFSQFFLYKLYSPVFIRNFDVFPVRRDAVSAIFICPATSEFYLPISHFYTFTTSQAWDSATQTLTLEITGGMIVEISAENSGLLLYRDMVHLPASKIAALFGLEILQDGEILILKSGETANINTVDIKRQFQPILSLPR
ncbi:MAG: hypothetical protein FWG68_00725 [Defluviitaleaceae bacterium]|nr:hypothetical protein [Defluviitaleaceae bacterium]